MDIGEIIPKDQALQKYNEYRERNPIDPKVEIYTNLAELIERLPIIKRAFIFNKRTKFSLSHRYTVFESHPKGITFVTIKYDDASEYLYYDNGIVRVVAKNRDKKFNLSDSESRNDFKELLESRTHAIAVGGDALNIWINEDEYTTRTPNDNKDEFRSVRARDVANKHFVEVNNMVTTALKKIQ